MAKYDPTHPHEKPQPDVTHDTLLIELCETIERRAPTPIRLDTYRHAVEMFPIEALKEALRGLYQQVPLPAHLPSPSELKEQVRRHVPKAPPRRDEERWRRRYDIWARGRFADDVLEVANALNDHDLELGQEDGAGQSIRCQHAHCHRLIPWPSEQGGYARMFCLAHQPVDAGKPVTRNEKESFLAQLSPEGKAFMRASVPTLMTEIPITAAEQAVVDAEAIPLRSRAFEHLSKGPGVNPGIFVTTPHG